MSLCVKFKGRLFDFHDVEGDVNCLHHALCVSVVTDGNTGPEVRFTCF